MISVTNSDEIRLTRREKNQLRDLTMADPSHIKTRGQLHQFIETHANLYESGGSPEERLLRKLLLSLAEKLS
jgi:hypothetical protein